MPFLTKGTSLTDATYPIVRRGCSCSADGFAVAALTGRAQPQAHLKPEHLCMACIINRAQTCLMPFTCLSEQRPHRPCYSVTASLCLQGPYPTITPLAAQPTVSTPIAIAFWASRWGESIELHMALATSIWTDRRIHDWRTAALKHCIAGRSSAGGESAMDAGPIELNVFSLRNPAGTWAVLTPCLTAPPTG